MSSSILYALCRSYRPPDKAFSSTYVPLLNIPRADIKLRPEFDAVLRHCQVRSESLTTLDDLPSFEALPPERTRWILVDHNKLEGELGKVYGKRVQGCIDHHEDENAVPPETTPEPRVVTKCGSCTSLIVDHLLEDVCRNQEHGLVLTEVIKLAMASILIDTTNLQDKHKTQPVDTNAVEFLDVELKKIVGSWDREAFFKEINDAKKNIESLPLQGIFRKDYKQWTENGIKLGTSSVVKPLSFLAQKCEAEGQETSKQNQTWQSMSESFMKAQELRLWTILTGYSPENDELCRELVLQWADEEAGKVVELFEKECCHALKLEKANVEGIGDGNSDNARGRKVWRQGNLKASRKQVAPLIRAAMRGLSSGSDEIQRMANDVEEM